MLLFQIHLASTLMLVGLIWTIQLVHYPLMLFIRQGFGEYHEQHCQRIFWLVGPLMGTEFVTAVSLALEPPKPLLESELWQGPIGPASLWIGVALILIAWATTAFVSVPTHSKLGQGHDPRAIAKLVSSNWVRTAAWSLRAVLLLWLGTSALG